MTITMKGSKSYVKRLSKLDAGIHRDVTKAIERLAKKFWAELYGERNNK